VTCRPWFPALAEQGFHAVERGVADDPGARDVVPAAVRRGRPAALDEASNTSAVLLDSAKVGTGTPRPAADPFWTSIRQRTCFRRGRSGGRCPRDVPASAAGLVGQGAGVGRWAGQVVARPERCLSYERVDGGGQFVEMVLPVRAARQYRAAVRPVNGDRGGRSVDQ
jgi:hypothetical protein